MEAQKPKGVKKAKDPEEAKRARDFGMLVKALREEHFDEDGSRWSRVRLAQECGLSIDLIEDIELGERLHLMSHELKELARGLKLTSRERHEFFFISSGIPTDDVARDKANAKAVLTSQLAMMGEIRLPCFLVDVLANIIAINDAIAQLFGVSSEVLRAAHEQQTGFNLLRVIFDTDQLSFRSTVGSKWEKYARHNIQYARVLSLRYRNTQKFKDLYKQLRKLPDFQIYWQQACEFEEDHYSTNLHYQYDHDDLGPLSYYTTSSISITGYGELSLTVYLPANALTAEAFSRLVQHGLHVWPLANWPD